MNGFFSAGCARAARLGVFTVVLTLAPSAAAQLLDVTGQVDLLGSDNPAGVDVALGMDLDRDGDLNSFEIVNARVSSDGSYRLTYTPDPADVDFEFLAFVTDLLVDYQSRGFDAVLDDGPLPVTLRFSREGYSTIVQRFSTFDDAPELNVTLVPLQSVFCEGTDCGSPDGKVNITGFPGGTGIARAFAQAYDPKNDTALFPGDFADDQDNLLISSGFTEIDLRDADGRPVTLLSKPVSVRFEANPESWASLRDLEPDSGIVEVPMYSFDEGTAEWVAEPDGELQDAEGNTISESEFSSIQEGSYDEPVFVAFETSHFSTFNCDAPVQERACVTGRLLFDGEPLGGAYVEADGVTYSGSAGRILVGADGRFAVDVMRSENEGEDVDRNFERGQSFEAQVLVFAMDGIFTGPIFETPKVTESVLQCQGAACDCLDLGDIDVVITPPRACEINIDVSFAASVDIDAGAATVADVNVTGRVQGRSVSSNPTLVCGTRVCGSAQTNGMGSATVVVPVGATSRVELRASVQRSNGSSLDTYEGTVVVDGCRQGVLSVDASIELNHRQLTPLEEFILGLGDGPAVVNPSTGTGSVTGNIIDILTGGSTGSSSTGSSSGSSNDDSGSGKKPFGCDCAVGSASPRVPLGGLATLGLVGVVALRRRRRDA